MDNHVELYVQRGSNWQKSIAMSLVLGTVVAVSTYVVTTVTFKDCFKRVEVYPLPKPSVG